MLVESKNRRGASQLGRVAICPWERLENHKGALNIGSVRTQDGEIGTQDLLKKVTNICNLVWFTEKKDS